MICTKKNLLLIFFILLIFGASAAALLLSHTYAKPAKTALIYQDGNLLQEIDLTNVPVPYTFTITSSDGGFNTIYVGQGKIGVSDADCPDKICRDMGLAETNRYPISCLPHKLLIQISSEDPALDGVTR